MKYFELGEETEYDGYSVEIVQDINSTSPRKDCNNLGTMLCRHCDYNLGDVQASSGQEIIDMIEDLDNSGGLWLPLYLYDHSGITMSTTKFSCSWDSGQVGIIYITREKIIKEYSCKRISKKLKENIYKCLKAEVQEYDYYLTGNSWGYRIKDSDGKEVDSCFGFYGDGFDNSLDYMEDEILVSIKHLKTQKVKKHCSMVKTWIKNKVPLINRQQKVCTY